ncbi:type IV pilus biogenesis protein PilM [Pseudomonas aeruginosa]|uniref:type IV pilus biogenesis protein PilM n=1 Tax=Pseudomonas aeruginosa TaxID=287 RepID=UPI0019D29F4B
MYKATTRPRAPNWPRSIPWPGACCSTAPAAEYAHANPGFTGSPADSALGLPAWFRKPAAASGLHRADTSYAFIASPAGLAAAVDARTESDWLASGATAS